MNTDLKTNAAGAQVCRPRLKWLDIARGLAFLMVIYSHLKYKDDTVMRYFTPMFLTMFFFVSGYLFKEGCSFAKVLEQRTRTLLLPFLTLGGVMILLSNILTFNAAKPPLSDEIKGLLFQNGHNQLLWFIAALYVYSLVFYWVERFSGSVDRLMAVCSALFVLNVAYSHWLKGPGLPWHIMSSGYACFYMALGKFYKHHEAKIDARLGWRSLILIAVVYFGFITVTGVSCSFSGSKYIVDSVALSVMSLILGVAVSKRFFQNSRFLLFVGANTLFYFAFHGKGYSLLQTVVEKVMSVLSISHTFWLDEMLGLVIVFLDALLLIIPAMLVNRYCPWLLGKGFKLWRAK